MNLSYLLNPLESGAKKDNVPSESESTSTPGSNNKVTTSGSIETPQRSTGDKVSSPANSEIDSTESRAQKGKDLQGHTDDDHDLADVRRSRHLNPFDPSPLGLIQEAVVKTSSLPRSGASSSSVLPRTRISWDDNHGKESIGAKRKQHRSIKPPWDPSSVSGLNIDSNCNSNSNSNDHSGSASSASDNAGLSDNRRRGDSFKRGKKSPELPDTEVEATLQPDLERTADGKFRCNWPRCGKEFSVALRLSTHFRIHLGKPPYLCGYKGCEKAFHTSSSLSHHRVVHTDQGLRPYVCRYDRCGATYTQLARLITHQRTTHSGSILFLSSEAVASSSSSPTSPLFGPSAPTSASINTIADGQLIREQPFNPSHIQPDHLQGSSTPRTEGDYQDENETEMRLRAEAALTMASFSTLATIRDRSSPWSSSDDTPPLAPVGSVDYHPRSAPYDDHRYNTQGPSQPTSQDQYQQHHPQGWFSNQPPVRPGHGYHRYSQGSSPLDQGDGPNHDRRLYFQRYSPQAQPVSPDQDRRHQRGASIQQSPSESSEDYYHREKGYFDSLYSSEGLSPPHEPPHDKESSLDRSQ